MPVLRGAVALLLMLAGGCAATTPVREFLPDDGPQVVNGLYEINNPVCAQECLDVLATRALPLRERPHPDAPIVATTHEGEWLSWVGELYRMRPMRGVLTQSITLEVNPGEAIAFQAGEIVYAIDTRVSDDAPQIGYWFRGHTFYRSSAGFEQIDETPFPIDWPTGNEEQEEADESAGAGWWAEVRRDNGQHGYVLLFDLDCWSGGKQSDECYPGWGE